MSDTMIRARLLAQDLAAFDVELSPDAARALALADALTATVHDEPPSYDLHNAVLSGSLKVEDVPKRVRAAARALAEQEHAKAIAQELQHAVARAFTTAIGRNAGRIVEALRPAFDAAAAGVAEAAAHLPPGTDADTALKGTDEAVSAWRALEAHRATLDAVRSVRLQLRAGRGTPSPVSLFVESVPDVDALADAAERYDATQGRERGGRWHHLAAGGYRLRLNTDAEAQALLQQAQAATAVQREAERQARPEPSRRQAQRYVDALRAGVLTT